MNIENPSIHTCTIRFDPIIYCPEGTKDYARQMLLCGKGSVNAGVYEVFQNPALHRFYLVRSEAVFQIIIDIREPHFSYLCARCRRYDAVCKGSA